MFYVKIPVNPVTHKKGVSRVMTRAFLFEIHYPLIDIT